MRAPARTARCHRSDAVGDLQSPARLRSERARFACRSLVIQGPEPVLTTMPEARCSRRSAHAQLLWFRFDDRFTETCRLGDTRSHSGRSSAFTPKRAWRPTLHVGWSQINFLRRGATFRPCGGAQRSAYQQDDSKAPVRACQGHARKVRRRTRPCRDRTGRRRGAGDARRIPAPTKGGRSPAPCGTAGRGPAPAACVSAARWAVHHTQRPKNLLPSLRRRAERSGCSAAAMILEETMRLEESLIVLRGGRRNATVGCAELLIRHSRTAEATAGCPPLPTVAAAALSAGVHPQRKRQGE